MQSAIKRQYHLNDSQRDSEAGRVNKAVVINSGKSWIHLLIINISRDGDTVFVHVWLAVFLLEKNKLLVIIEDVRLPTSQTLTEAQKNTNFSTGKNRKRTLNEKLVRLTRTERCPYQNWNRIIVEFELNLKIARWRSCSNRRPWLKLMRLSSANEKT